MPPKKDKPHPKAVAALERQVAVLREKKETAARAAEDAKWADEGSTLKERRAAEKAQKTREKSEQQQKKKALMAESDAADANDEAALQARTGGRPPTLGGRILGDFVYKFRSVKISRHDLQSQREREAAVKRLEQDAELNKRLNKMLAPVSKEGRSKEGAAEDFGLPSNPNQERAGHLASDAVRLGGTDNVVEASGITNALKALDFRGATLANVGDRHPEKRRKAAFKAYEATMMKELKEEYPTLKFSQLKQKVFEMWQDAPENPVNQKDE